MPRCYSYLKNGWWWKTKQRSLSLSKTLTHHHRPKKERKRKTKSFRCFCCRPFLFFFFVFFFFTHVRFVVKTSSGKQRKKHVENPKLRWIFPTKFFPYIATYKVRECNAEARVRTLLSICRERDRVLLRTTARVLFVGETTPQRWNVSGRDHLITRVEFFVLSRCVSTVSRGSTHRQKGERDHFFELVSSFFLFKKKLPRFKL